MLPIPGAFVRNILRELYRATDPFVKSGRSLPDFLDKYTDAFIYSPQYLPFLMKEFRGGKFVPSDGVPGGRLRRKGTQYVYVEEAEQVMQWAILETQQRVVVLYHSDNTKPQPSILPLLSRVCTMKENLLKLERLSAQLKKTISASMKMDFSHLEKIEERERQLGDALPLFVSELKRELTPSESEIELTTEFIVNIHDLALERLNTLEASKKK
jgi:hypothetical protein